MKSKNLRDTILALSGNQGGSICISIIVPVSGRSNEWKTDHEILARLTDSAKKLLLSSYAPDEISGLIEKLEGLVGSIRFTGHMKGLGLYISSSVCFSEWFPFTVTEKIMVNDQFELRELWYKEALADTCYLLLLGEECCRLVKCSGETITEVKDERFPAKYRDDHSYARPAPSSSSAGYAHVKAFGKDKTEMEHIRLGQFFRTVDDLLDNYLRPDTPLVLMGVERELSEFSASVRHNRNIVRKVEGAHIHMTADRMRDIAMEALMSYTERIQQAMVTEFEEKTGSGAGVAGIHDVWTAAHDGKAFKLLVEKDYRQPGFAAYNGNRLYLRAQTQPGIVMADAVDVIIQTVLDKNGQVFFVDNDRLKDHQHIALITRY